MTQKPKPDLMVYIIFLLMFGLPVGVSMFAILFLRDHHDPPLGLLDFAYMGVVALLCIMFYRIKPFDRWLLNKINQGLGH